LTIGVKNSAKVTLLSFDATAIFLQQRNGVVKWRPWSTWCACVGSLELRV